MACEHGKRDRRNCKICDPEKYAANLAYKKARYEANRGEHKVRCKAYYEANRDRVAARLKRYYEANRDKKLAYVKAYNKTNRDEIKERQKKWYIAHREELKAYRETNRDEIKARYEANKCEHGRLRRKCLVCCPLGYAKGSVKAAKCRAKRDGLPCTIDAAFVLRQLRTSCPVFGTPFDHGNNIHRATSPSLDKFNPSLGYTPENTWVISNRANTIKQDADAETVMRVFSWMSIAQRFQRTLTMEEFKRTRDNLNELIKNTTTHYLDEVAAQRGVEKCRYSSTSAQSVTPLKKDSRRLQSPKSRSGARAVAS
jgi:hypothetical protein